jgi:hypothetical protein
MILKISRAWAVEAAAVLRQLAAKKAVEPCRCRRFIGNRRMWSLNFLRGGFCLIALATVSFGFVSSSDIAVAAEPQVPVPEVTVSAPRPPDAGQLAGDSVPKFIAAHGRPARVTGQLARWRDGVCPSTSGLTPAFNSFVSARIAAVAASVGAPHRDREHCKANIRIVFTTEPQKFIDAVSRKHSVLLGYHYSRDAKAIVTFRHPIQGWYVTATQNADGDIGLDDAMPMQQQSTDMSMMNAAKFALQSGTTPGGRLGSRLVTGLSSLLVHVLVVADTVKVTGYTIGSISDYLAMLVLSQTQSSDTCGPLPSILDLMAANCDKRERPDAVTAGDLAFLRALYSMDLREKYALQEGDILNNMMKQFKTR